MQWVEQKQKEEAKEIKRTLVEEMSDSNIEPEDDLDYPIIKMRKNQKVYGQSFFPGNSYPQKTFSQYFQAWMAWAHEMDEKQRNTARMIEAERMSSPN